MVSTVQSQTISFDLRLFRAAIRVSAARCGALFRAGIVARGEAEQLKNGLWTILKRAEFDRQFLESATATTIFEFVADRLFQLVGDAARAIEIERDENFQQSVALRLWLRDEITNARRAIEQTLLDANSVDADFQFILVDLDARLKMVWERINVLPIGAATTGEIDFQIVADELEFEITTAAKTNAFAHDFTIDFAHAAATTMLRLSALTARFSNQNNSMLRGKTNKVFGLQHALLSTLNHEADANFQILCEIVFEIAAALEFGTTALLAVNSKR